MTSRGNLAASYWQAGRIDRAIELLEQVVTDAERLLGHDHPDTRQTADALRGWRMLGLAIHHSPDLPT
ncbi:tetratricopeptide repeat protein [Kitasatospora sp. NPDC048365]|uniref:tetratricopeptide repeat protein n=1 Tax=Kitasatospora sp. NPDC048365 TaxID=3364050 RepID=UPI00371C0395